MSDWGATVEFSLVEGDQFAGEDLSDDDVKDNWDDSSEEEVEEEKPVTKAEGSSSKPKVGKKAKLSAKEKRAKEQEAKEAQRRALEEAQKDDGLSASERRKQRLDMQKNADLEHAADLFSAGPSKGGNANSDDDFFSTADYGDDDDDDEDDANAASSAKKGGKSKKKKKNSTEDDDDEDDFFSTADYGEEKQKKLDDTLAAEQDFFGCSDDEDDTPAVGAHKKSLDDLRPRNAAEFDEFGELLLAKLRGFASSKHFVEMFNSVLRGLQDELEPGDYKEFSKVCNLQANAILKQRQGKRKVSTKKSLTVIADSAYNFDE
eukprot:CAMPEP_0177642212 /NCGR_PEP_ID=MMETSP0447-20121125/7466_1 /TAXON_ID=0 /ORGANISM="Stygamoeba regulata, Strain BSH-02190019" /LENGTH=317 /DNA_ID=CAMNT_0019144355 /DNA_START=29 /DNA_END=982 /DNA_ORIENTATION=+